MDKDILIGIQNIGNALDAMAKAMKKNASKANKNKIVFETKIGNQCVIIIESLKSIKNDTRKILKNQESIDAMIKAKQKPSVFEIASNKKEKILDGVGSVIKIAAGVLAIGFAFKMIGQVDFLSVIALSIALPIIAFSFQKIAEMKNLKPKETGNLVLTIVGISTAIVVSSWLLQGIVPLDIKQSVTAILIAGMFTTISYGLSSLVNSLKNVNIKNIWYLPIILPEVAFAIAVSSWMLQLVKPIDIKQGLSSVFIAAMFTTIAYGLGKLVEGVGKADMKKIFLLPILLPEIALAIAASSWALQYVKPITITQAITSVFVAGTLALMSLALPFIIKSMEEISWATMLKIGAILPILATAIMISSYPLSKTQIIPYGDLLNITVFSISLAISTVVVGGAVWLLSKMGLASQAGLEGAGAMIVLSGVIWLTSWILGAGNYGNYPDWKWSLSVGLSVVMFGVSALALGLIMLTGVGAVAMGLGALGILALSGVVVLTAAILDLGKYGNYPNLEWSKGVGLSLLLFGGSALILGAVMMTGVGAIALVVGAKGINILANSIVSVSNILGKGNFSGGPDKEWAEAVGISLTSFGKWTLLLGAIIMIPFGRKMLNKGAEGVNILANSIVSVSNILSGGNFNGGPKKEWAEGVGMSIAAFSPVFTILMANKVMSLFGKSGGSIDDYVEGIKMVAQGIVVAGEFFAQAKNNGTWAGGPSKEWAEGVGGALGAFAPVFVALKESKGLFGSGPTPLEMENAMKSIASTIIAVGAAFNGKTADGVKINDTFWQGGPTETWSSNISTALAAFSPIFDYLHENSHWYGANTSDLNDGIAAIGTGIKSIAESLGGTVFTNTIPEGYMKSLSDNVRMYVSLVQYLQEKNINGLSSFSVLGITFGLYQLASSYDMLSKSISKFAKSLDTIDVDKLDAVNNLSGSIVLMSLMDSDQFSRMMDALESKTGIYIKTIEALQGNATAIQNSSGTTFGSVNRGVTSGEANTISVLESMDAKLSILVTNSGLTVKNGDDFLNYLHSNTSSPSLSNKKIIQK